MESGDEFEFMDSFLDPAPEPELAVSEDAAALLALLTEKGKGDGYWQSPVWLSRGDFLQLSDLPPERVRKAIVEVLQAKRITAPMCGLYALKAASISWMANLPLRFTPRELGKIWCEANEVPWTQSLAKARYLCGIQPEANDDQSLAVPEQYAGRRPGGCHLEPTPGWVFDLPDTGFVRMVAQAIRHDVAAGISAEALKEQGRMLGLRAKQSADAEMEETVAILHGRDLEPYALFAQAALNTVRGDHTPTFIAPRAWEPPAVDDPTIAFVDEWWLRESRAGNGELMLAARYLDHPTLGSQESLSHSSPLIWIDEGRGWARTVSRHYRLGKRLK